MKEYKWLGDLNKNLAQKLDKALNKNYQLTKKVAKLENIIKSLNRDKKKEMDKKYLKKLVEKTFYAIAEVGISIEESEKEEKSKKEMNKKSDLNKDLDFRVRDHWITELCERISRLEHNEREKASIKWTRQMERQLMNLKEKVENLAYKLEIAIINSDIPYKHAAQPKKEPADNPPKGPKQ